MAAPEPTRGVEWIRAVASYPLAGARYANPHPGAEVIAVVPVRAFAPDGPIVVGLWLYPGGHVEWATQNGDVLGHSFESPAETGMAEATVAAVNRDDPEDCEACVLAAELGGGDCLFHEGVMVGFDVAVAGLRSLVQAGGSRFAEVVSDSLVADAERTTARIRSGSGG